MTDAGRLSEAEHSVCKSELNALRRRDKRVKDYFELPVDVTLYPDYVDVVKRPICLSEIEVRLVSAVVAWCLLLASGVSIDAVACGTAVAAVISKDATVRWLWFVGTCVVVRGQGKLGAEVSATQYLSMAAFFEDVALVFSNCVAYCTHCKLEVCSG